RRTSNDVSILSAYHILWRRWRLFARLYRDEKSLTRATRLDIPIAEARGFEAEFGNLATVVAFITPKEKPYAPSDPAFNRAAAGSGFYHGGFRRPCPG
ncbi:MAG: hypothetical protein AAF653_16200, partial [Chloroflexota bacterium]